MSWTCRPGRSGPTIPRGTYLRTIGGPGSGPGELSQQAPFVFADDEGGLIVPDLGNQRVSRYGPGGDPAGSFPIQMQSGVPTRWMLDRSGRLMAQLRGLDIPGMAALSEGDPIVVYDTTGAVTDTVAILPKGQMLEGMTEERLSITLFAPEPVWDLAPDGSVVYAMNDQYRILVNGPDGKPPAHHHPGGAPQAGGGDRQERHPQAHERAV
jgi:hypothetical protein